MTRMNVRKLGFTICAILGFSASNALAVTGATYCQTDNTYFELLSSEISPNSNVCAGCSIKACVNSKDSNGNWKKGQYISGCVSKCDKFNGAYNTWKASCTSVAIPPSEGLVNDGPNGSNYNTWVAANNCKTNPTNAGFCTDYNELLTETNTTLPNLQADLKAQKAIVTKITAISAKKRTAAQDAALTAAQDAVTADNASIKTTTASIKTLTKAIPGDVETLASSYSSSAEQPWQTLVAGCISAYSTASNCDTNAWSILSGYFTELNVPSAMGAIESASNTPATILASCTQETNSAGATIDGSALYKILSAKKQAKTSDCGAASLKIKSNLNSSDAGCRVLSAMGY